MKNIHLVLAGESRLSLNRSYRDYTIGTEAGEPYWTYSQYKHHMSVTDASVRPHNMYITNEEKFVRDEYITDGIEVIKATPKLVNAQGLVDRRDWKKIILTTDLDLIKDGVQEIDDEFLEWFVKNPSCEWVEVRYTVDFNSKAIIIIPKEDAKHHSFCETPEEKCTMNYCDTNGCQNRKRELVELKEQFKQETLEEVRKVERTELFNSIFSVVKQIPRKDVDGDAMDAPSCAYEIEQLFYKWQQDKMYSDEEVLNFTQTMIMQYKFGNTNIEQMDLLKETLQLFKNK
jgi:hypothetical protein